VDLDDELVARCTGRVGTTLNAKWRLDELIGVGGMAAVYAASHRNGARAAIKILHPEIAAQPEARERFAREAYIANSIGHEGAVGVHDDDVTDEGAPYLVMELLHGESVARRADRKGGSLPVGEVLAIASQALSVLELAHEKGVVHRDIKPENLFVTEEGRLKVLDFGVARLNEGAGGPKRTRTGFLLGTPGYMSPEQALGRWSDVDARTDVWALGATMFNLLSGQDVHEGVTPNEQVVAAATRPARSLARVLSGAPIELVTLVDRALAFDQGKRFADARAMRAEVDKVMGQAPAPVIARTVRPPALGVAFASSARTEMDPSAAEGAPSVFGSVKATPQEVAALQELFTLVEKAILAKAQYGPAHKESVRRFEAAFRQAVQTIDVAGGKVAWNISPYAFVAGKDVLWEPKAPLDTIPYRLFADGVRMLGLARGLETRELADLLEIFTRDPAHNIAPEDDLVTLLWDAKLVHVEHEAFDSFAEGDQDDRAQFESERQKVIALAGFDTSFQLEDCWQARGSVAEAGAGSIAASQRALLDSLAGEAAARAAAMSVAEAPTGVRARSGTMGTDAATRSVLATRMEPGAAEVGQRFVVAAATAFVRATERGNPAQVTAPLRVAIDGLADTSPADAVAFVGALCRAVRSCGGAPVAEREAQSAALAGTLVSTKTLKAILAGATPRAADQLAGILRYLDGTHMPVVLEALHPSREHELMQHLLAYVERTGAGHETEIGPLLPVVEVELALALLRLLLSLGTPAAREAAIQAAKSTHPIVRIEALGHVEGQSSERLRLELRRLLEDPEEGVRLATLRAIAKYGVKAAGPSLVLRIRSQEFDGLPIDERRQALDTLAALMPSRAEAVGIDLLADHRLVPSEAHEQTRALAAELLEREGSTPEALDALNSASRGRWRNSERVRSAAARALPRVEARASRPPPSEPERKSS
jgi:hypothetical protein